jgi:hypothetical protein
MDTNKNIEYDSDQHRYVDTSYNLKNEIFECIYQTLRHVLCWRQI